MHPRLQADEVLPWSRTQQAAFLISMGIQVCEAIEKSHSEWAEQIRDATNDGLFEDHEDPAFYSSVSLLTNDVGIRGLLFVVNDLCFLRAKELGLSAWTIGESAEPDQESISTALKSLSKLPVSAFLGRLAKHLGEFDWRSSAAPGLSEVETTVKKTLRGSGGYREIRRLLLQHLAKAKDDVGAVARLAAQVLKLS